MPYAPLDDRRYRQVHLDFHTGEHVPDVGAGFDPDEFVATLRAGHVDAVNLFAKCHHSWSYYPTEVGRRHPNLVPGLDLLGEQVRACHAAGIRCPIYYTVGWSSNDRIDHPEWGVRQKDGSPKANSPEHDFDATPGTPKPPGGWVFLCPSGGYRRLILDQTREIMGRYDVDGMWYDICNLETCWCDDCRAGMKEAGLRRGRRRRRGEVLRGQVGVVHEGLPRRHRGALADGDGVLQRPDPPRHAAARAGAAVALRDGGPAHRLGRLRQAPAAAPASSPATARAWSP